MRPMADATDATDALGSPPIMRSLQKVQKITSLQHSDSTSTSSAITGVSSESSTPECLKPRTKEEARDMRLLQIHDRRISKHCEALSRKQSQICTDESNQDESSMESGVCGEKSRRQKIVKPKSYFNAKERAKNRDGMDQFRKQRKLLRENQRHLLQNQDHMLQNQDDMLQNQDDMLQNQGQIMQNQALSQAWQRRKFNSLQESSDINTHILFQMARKMNIDPNDAFASANTPGQTRHPAPDPFNNVDSLVNKSKWIAVTSRALGRTLQSRMLDLGEAERGSFPNKDDIDNTSDMPSIVSASSTIEVVPLEVSHDDNAPLQTKDSKKAIGVEIETNRPTGCENAFIEKPALPPQASESGDIHSPSPSTEASEPSPELPPALKSKVKPPLNTTMGGLNSSLAGKGEAKNESVGIYSNGTNPSINTAPIIVSVDAASSVSRTIFKTSEAEQSVVQPPTSKEEGMASTRCRIDKPKTSRDSAMAEMMNKKSKSALRLRQDSFKSSSRSVAKPGPLSALADTSNKPGISVKQRKQAIIQPRENKAAALRAKKNRERVAEQKLKEKMEEVRKKKEQQRKEKEIERNVDQRWCSGV